MTSGRGSVAMNRASSTARTRPFSPEGMSGVRSSNPKRFHPEMAWNEGRMRGSSKAWRRRFAKRVACPA